MLNVTNLYITEFLKMMKICSAPVERGIIFFLATILFASVLAPSGLIAQHVKPDGQEADAGANIHLTSPFYVYQDGAFREAIVTKEPELIGGKDLMETLIKLNIRYPDHAKEKKIGGTVVVSVVIDSIGQMEDAFIKEGIGGGCNDEALRAVRLMQKIGFTAGEQDGRPVTVMFDIPITFLPQ